MILFVCLFIVVKVPFPAITLELAVLCGNLIFNLKAKKTCLELMTVLTNGFPGRHLEGGQLGTDIWSLTREQLFFVGSYVICV